MEECVPVGKEAVPGADGGAYEGGVGLTEHPRFSTLGIEVSMPAEKWIKGTKLVPPCLKKRIGVIEETTNISSSKVNASQPKG